MDVAVSADKPEGRYDTIPTSVAITFPDTVDMGTVATTDFTIADTCASAAPEIDVTVSGLIATVAISGATACENTETVTIGVKFKRIGLNDGKTRIQTSTTSFTYTRDTTAPTVAASLGVISNITSSASYAFTSIPTLTLTFSTDIDMSTVEDTDIVISSAGGTDCSTMPTVGTLVKGTSTVTVPLTGGTCGDEESFRITLSQDAFADSRRDGATGAADALTAPSADIEIDATISSDGVSVTSVGAGATTADDSYGVGTNIDIIISFDSAVTVTGSPRMQLNVTGSATRYATYLSGSGTTDLVFRYTVQANDMASELDYSSTTALTLNGGTITRSGGIQATLTLATPGATNSLGDNRDIEINSSAPGITASSPSGPTDIWGLGARTVTFTFSEAIDAASLDDSDLTITAGTCATPPTVSSSSVTGGSGNIASFMLTTNTCADGETYTLELDPGSVTDLAANAGNGSSRAIAVTTETTAPTLNLSAPSVTRINASGSTSYTVTYSGATGVTLSSGDITIGGASTDCQANVTGSGTTTRTITITDCSADGAVQIEVAAGTATNVYGNEADAVAEGAITDFTADNTELPDPTHSLPTIGANAVYNLDSLSAFTLTFAGDDLGTTAQMQSSLNLECDGNTVTKTATRTNATDVNVAPNEASGDFVYGANCNIAGTNVPDSAGNLHTFAGLPFKVGRELSAVSGPTSNVNIASASDLGNVVFNVALNPTTIDNTNVTLECDSQNIPISSLNLSNADTEVLIDFDESDVTWTSFVGGESCTLEFSTAVENSLGMPLAAPETFNFTLDP